MWVHGRVDRCQRVCVYHCDAEGHVADEGEGVAGVDCQRGEDGLQALGEVRGQLAGGEEGGRKASAGRGLQVPRGWPGYRHKLPLIHFPLRLRFSGVWMSGVDVLRILGY